MTSRRLLPVAVVLVALSAGLFAQTRPVMKKGKAKAKPVPVVQVPTLPPPSEVAPAPLTLAQKPAVPPKVQYQNSQLTILAENCTLGDILRAVRQQTGAEVDLPPNATERVVANLGPGPSRDILTKLLNGSSFNYVMLGSPTDPNDVRHVILTSKSGGDTGAVANNMPQPGFNGRTPLNPPQNGPMVTGGAPPDASNDDDAAENSASDDQPQAEDQPAADGQGGDQAGQPANGQGVKTPEQLLQELQRQQQMQQQQQQQGQPGQSAPQGFPPPPQNPEQEK
jgi:hypothetical protein